MPEAPRAPSILNRAALLRGGDARRILVDFLDGLLAEITPARILKSRVRLDDTTLYIDDERIRLEGYRRTFLLGAGKAAYGMTRAFLEALGKRDVQGFVFAPEGRFSLAAGVGSGQPGLRRLGANAAQLPPTELIGSLAPFYEDDVVFVLLSGGASGLLSEPVDGLPLDEKRAVVDLLQRRGASIHEVNTVRKHLSKLKGGWLVKALAPAAVVTLAISDVVGNEPDVIGSGPTSPDPTTYWDAIAVLHKYDVWDQAGPSVRRVLLEGVMGLRGETPKPGNPLFRKCRFHILADHHTLLETAMRVGRGMGLHVTPLTHRLQGEASRLGGWLARLAGWMRGEGVRGSPRLLVASGESVVTVRGAGVGGRNQELALSFALNMPSMRGVSLVSFATDGVDGPTPAAGALVDEQALEMAKGMALNPEHYLVNNDSHTFFSKVQTTIETGPTGSNLGDLVAILLEA